MKVIGLLLACGLLFLSSCGGESDTESAPQTADTGSPTGEEKTDADDAARGATTITVGDSEFGRMLFGSNGQAIYIFQKDPNGETVCYGECAEAWPPVVTDGKLQAGKGVDDSLLGTVERRDGQVQVTYDGQPLYFYANEAPGEVRCHNVNLNGGLWWVVGPDGERRP